MLNIFRRKSKSPQPEEQTPQLTLYERRALEWPGTLTVTGSLPTKTYDDMERDPMVQTALNIKKLGVLAVEYKLIPANESEDAARALEFVQETFDRMEGSPHTILLGAMDAFAKGWSVQELVLALDRDQKIRLKACKPKDTSYFGMQADEFGNIQELQLRIPSEEPRWLPREKFVIYANRPYYGKPKGRSDLDPIYKHYQSKQTLLTAWKTHLERFAMPTVLGRYERGLPTEDQSAILRALQSLQDSTAIVFPKEIEVSTLGGGNTPSKGFIEAIEFHNREIARAILGQTLTTDEGRRVGSLTLGKIHLQVMLLQLNSIRQELADLVMTEQVIKPLVELNFGPDLAPRFEFDQPVLGAFATGKVS